MLTPKFNLPRPTFIIRLNAFTIATSLCALWLWHAPLSDRLIVMSAVIILGTGYFFWLMKTYFKRYPARLSFKEDNWYLNDQAVTIDSSTILTPYYAALCLKGLSKKKYRLIATQQSFLEPKDYYDFIRFLKIHRGSF